MFHKMEYIKSRLAYFSIYFVYICIMVGINNMIDQFVTAKFFIRFYILEFIGFFGALLIVCLTSKIKGLGKYLYMRRKRE